MLNREDARSSTGHGSPVPHLVHGGPGRAGGGEELGGIRSVMHHMQRTAIQGSPNMLTAVTGVWHTGADRNFTARDRGPAPVPEVAWPRCTSATPSAPELREVTLEDITTFANSTGDTFYAHTNQEAAAANPFFPGIVAHGYLLLAWAAGLFVEPAPGPVLANYGLENLRFITPVAAGRLHPGHPDGQEDHPARDRRVRRGGLGRRPDQPERRDRGHLRRPDPRGEVTHAPGRSLTSCGVSRTLSHPVRDEPLRRVDAAGM